MLVLSANEKEFIQIGERIRITTWRNGAVIRIGIQAPHDVLITRVPMGGPCPYSKALQNTIWMDKELDSKKGGKAHG